MYNIIHISNEWYFDTINKVHIQKEGLELYKQYLKTKNE
jgi:hypothetical protein